MLQLANRSVRAKAARASQSARSVSCAAAKRGADVAPLTSALAVTASILLTTGAASASAADLALGAQVFNGNCAACHMGGRNSVMPEKTLDKAALEQYLDGGFKVESSIYQVENGKGAMPAWADRLSEEEIQAVAEYVFKQATDAAWKY
nr:pre-apocytochrome c552 [Chlamydomonas reinhardtii]